MNLYYPSAIWKPGPLGNFYPEKNSIEGAILHSAGGDWSGTYRPTDTMAQRGVSWTFSIFKSGIVEQHYPLDTSCWHAGGKLNNTRYIGIEHEGGGPNSPSEPLTEAQVSASLALVLWLRDQAGWADIARHVRLFEHNEVTQTSCPNGRIPWGRYILPVTPLPGGEFLPEPDSDPLPPLDFGVVAGLWSWVVNPAARNDFDVTPIPAPRGDGWEAWLVQRQKR